MITSILEFFALGTIGFWILSAAISVIFIAAIENEKYILPNLLLIALTIVYWKSLVALQWSLSAIVIGVVVYVVIGIMWSIFKWFHYLRKRVNELNEEGPVTEYVKDTLHVSKHKSRITTWIAYWPWSLLWTLTGDFFSTVYESLSGVYQKIADKELARLKLREKK